MFNHSHGKNAPHKPSKLRLRWLIYILPVWGFLVLGMCQLNFPPISHMLVGPDDYMRAVRAFELLAGGGHDTLQPRLGPEGTDINWSRLVDWPLALLVGALTPLAGSAQQALYWAATILPVCQLLLFLVLVCWAVSPLTGEKAAPVALVAAFVLVKVISEFTTGRIDHHGWQILLMTAGYGSLLRLYFQPDKHLWPVVAGLCFATGFAIGADLVLWTGLAAMLGGLFWLRAGQAYERPNLVFGASLYGATLVYLLALKRPADWAVPACDGLSLTYLALAFAVLLFWGCVYSLPEKLKARRIAVSLSLVLLISAALYALFPHCFVDPYGLASEKLYAIWQGEIEEARTLWEHAAYAPSAVILFLLPLLCGAASLLAALRYDHANRSFWFGFAVISAIGLIVSLFQIRVLTFMQILTLWPASWGVIALSAWLGSRRVSAKGLVVVSVIFAALLLSLSLPKKKADAVQSNMLSARYCPAIEVSDALSAYGKGDKDHNDAAGLMLLSSYIFNGSELLFRTPHRVLAAPYHGAAAGMLASYEIFAADADRQARQLARDYGVDLLLVCPGYWPFPPQEIEGENTLIRRLLMQNPPAWLERTEITGGGFIVYRVR